MQTLNWFKKRTCTAFLCYTIHAGITTIPARAFHRELFYTDVRQDTPFGGVFLFIITFMYTISASLIERSKKMASRLRY